MYPLLIILFSYACQDMEKSEEVEHPVSLPGSKSLPVASIHMSERLVSSVKQPILVDTVQSTHKQLHSVALALTEKAREGGAHARDVTHSDDLISFEETLQKTSPV